MLVTTEENFDIIRGEGFRTHGIESSQRRKASRFTRDDRVLYYLADRRVFAATATVTKGRHEDSSKVCKHQDESASFPHRIGLSPDVLLDNDQFIDALQIGPRLEYIRRWAPEDWQLAFLGPLHILPQRDFAYVEEEMKRIRSRRSRGRSRRHRRNQRGIGPMQPTECVDGASESNRSQESISGAGNTQDRADHNAVPTVATGDDNPS